MNALSEVRYLQGVPDESHRLYLESTAVPDGEPVNAFFTPSVEVISRGDPGWAVFLLALAVRLLPKDPIPAKRGGELLLELGLFEKAVGWLETARKRSPGDTRIVALLEKALACRQPV